MDVLTMIDVLYPHIFENELEFLLSYGLDSNIPFFLSFEYRMDTRVCKLLAPFGFDSRTIQECRYLPITHFSFFMKISNKNVNDTLSD